MIKWIIGSAIVMAIVLWCFGVRAQTVTIYTGPNGGYVGQAVTMSPTQPNPPIWSPNAQ
jgi:hypothetical protein